MTGTHENRVTLPVDAAALAAAARAVLESNWRPEGYTVPNAEVYPFQWLWDSCFHAIAWAELGSAQRALSELAHLFRTQGSDGFVPHIDYEFAPMHHADFWGQPDRSTITQPPMFGHAIAELHRRHIDVSSLLEPATRALLFLFNERERVDGLIGLCHPWESGADDCPRWDHWCEGEWNLDSWRQRKSALVATVVTNGSGSPVANREFRVGSCGFNALVAFNALELAEVTEDPQLRSLATELVASLDTRWDADLETWIDTGDAERTSGRVRSLDALLPVLVTTRQEALDSVFAQLDDQAAFGGWSGPAGLHRAEPVFAARTYWRGPAWPQLSYLVCVAARTRSSFDRTQRLAAAFLNGAVQSRWAEYWDADDGTGLGAAPQSWTAVVVAILGDAARALQ
jgi:glucosylglycerate hydrolase